MSPLRLFITNLILALALAASGSAQTPEEHEKHHPKARGEKKEKDNAGMMGGMDMEGMMKNMGVPPARELYPSLMEHPTLTPEERQALEKRAHERMEAGAALLSRGLDALSRNASTDDFRAMERDVAEMREGLSEFESGLATHRLLAEGKSPRAVALQWFKREMNLAPASREDHATGPFGLSWFHFLVMLVLIGFTISMVAMYFRKMRRATHLLEQLAMRAVDPGGQRAALAAASRPERWAGDLRVVHTFEEAPNVQTLRLVDPETGGSPFAFVPGQFLTLRALVDGKSVQRPYTIASSPTRDYVEITVKREEHGRVSSFLHEQVSAGSALAVSGPSGSFTFDGTEATSVVLIAGGVGITPIMSVIRFLTDRAWQGEIFLIYSARSEKELIYRNELKQLTTRHENLKTTFTLTKEKKKSWKGARGRISKELIVTTVPNVQSRRIHVCGPGPLMDDVLSMLSQIGVADSSVHKEAFGSPKAASMKSPTELASDEDGHSVTFSSAGISGVLANGRTVLDLADDLGVSIDSSCREGTCGVCMVKLIAGTVEMGTDPALTSSDRDQGMILACQAEASSDLTVEA